MTLPAAHECACDKRSFKYNRALKYPGSDVHLCPYWPEVPETVKAE